MADVFVASLASLWSKAPSRTLQRLILGTKELRRADASSVSSRASAADYRWTGGTAATQSHRRRLVHAYVETLSRELGIASWSHSEGTSDDDPPPGTHLDPHVSAFLRSAAIGASGNLPSMAFARFPNFMVMDTANLYLPTAFDGVFVGLPHIIGSAPRLADELRDLAGFLGLDTSQRAWWRTPALVNDTPQRRALYNLQLLGIACSQSADSSLPVMIR
ncbi:hypothetical protein BH11MYX2_BH11MYX2_21110 [soil metagenome]